MAAPATVSGEPRANHATGQPGRRRKAGTREPGDLPSAVVTHEHIGRGAPMGTRSRLSAESASGLWFVVTCHVAARPEKCPVHAQISASRIALALFSIPLACRIHQASAADSDALSGAGFTAACGRHADPPADTRKRGRQQHHRHHQRGDRAQAGADIARCASGRAGSQCCPNRRARRNDLGLHPRRQLEPDQGLHRRHRRDRSGNRHIQFRAYPDLGHRPRRDRARTAKRPLRRRRDRRGRQHHHEARVGSRRNSGAASKAVPSGPSTRMSE